MGLFLDTWIPSRLATIQSQGHPAAGIIGWTGGNVTSAGVAVTDQTAMTYSAVWACSRLLSGTTGMLPLNLVRIRKGGGADVVTDDPRQIILHDKSDSRPYKGMNSMMFRAMNTERQVNAGNGRSEIERDGDGKAIALHPIHPSNIRPFYDNDNLKYEVRSAKQNYYLDAIDVLDVASWMSDDGVNGKGVIRQARESIGAGLAAEQHGGAFFGNGARPSGILTHPKFLGPDERKNVRREWNEVHGGAEKSGKVGILWEGMTYAPLSFNNNDSQFLETRQHNIEDIARWYGVPPHLIGHLLRATFSNIEHQGIEFVKYCLMPWLVMWEKELEAKLLLPSERGLYAIKFNVNALMRGDSAARGAFYQLMLDRGAFSVNTVLELEDMNPIGPDGDKRLVPLNMQLLSQVGEQPMQPPEVPKPVDPPAEEPEDESEEPTETEDGLSAALASMQTAIASLKPAAPTIVEVVKEVVVEVQTERLSLAKQWLSRDLLRMITKEQNAANRAAAKPEDFLSWMGEFYGKHECQLAEAIEQPATVLGIAPMEAAKRHAAESVALLTAVYDTATKEEFAGKIAEVTGQWPKRTIN